MIMKKILVVLLSVLLVLSFASCSKEEESSSSGSTATAAAEASSTIKAVELSASTGGMSASSAAGRGLTKFAELVDEYSGGAMKVQVFYDTTLGNSTAVVSGMIQGTVDIGICGDSYYSGLVPEIQAFELPFMFEDKEDARSAVNGESGQYVLDQLATKGIQGLSFWEIGFRQLTNNIRPVSTPADLNGIKIRCLPATYQVKAWEAAGAIPVPMDVSELYSSLQQKVVDGQENPISEIYANRFYEVQKYISMTNHVYTPMLLSMSAIRWAGLDDAQKDIIMKAAKEAQAEVYRINDEEEQELLDEMIQAGDLELTSEVDSEAFRSLMSVSYDLFRKDYGSEFLDMLQGTGSAE